MAPKGAAFGWLTASSLCGPSTGSSAPIGAPLKAGDGLATGTSVKELKKAQIVPMGALPRPSLRDRRVADDDHPCASRLSSPVLEEMSPAA